MAKKKPMKAAKQAAANDVPAGVATKVEEAAAKPAETISKADTVRKAMAAGKDNPTEGSIYIQAEFGLDVPPQVFSTYKTIEKKKAEGKPGRAAKPTEPTAAPNAKPVKGDAVELVRQVKELVETYGADAVRDMTRVFAD
ncbi:hypothetical protein [Limnoglobus roseus]|uniref:Uncharacterized protein n=1 Tax=Limnoglobus roseus TaxID=2598579 RepID=A0A5C1AIH0_9BACT|nr:hypothetical protein [Limnoglobus roseus]QEL16924.1 hypothetical protein PX52LOC_03900 [Limnoglobus roseus]